MCFCFLPRKTSFFVEFCSVPQRTGFARTFARWEVFLSTYTPPPKTDYISFAAMAAKLCEAFLLARLFLLYYNDCKDRTVVKAWSTGRSFVPEG